MEFTDGAYWWKPDPKHVQEIIEARGLAGGKAPSTPGTKATMKNLADAKVSLSVVESENFQVLAMLCHRLDDPTIPFEMAMVKSGMRKPTVKTMARLIRVIRKCTDKVQAGQYPA